MNKTWSQDTVLPYEQDPTRGHKLYPTSNGITHQKKNPGPGLESNALPTCPKNPGPLDQETKLIPAAADRTPLNNHT